MKAVPQVQHAVAIGHGEMVYFYGSPAAVEHFGQFGQVTHCYGAAEDSHYIVIDPRFNAEEVKAYMRDWKPEARKVPKAIDLVSIRHDKLVDFYATPEAVEDFRRCQFGTIRVDPCGKPDKYYIVIDPRFDAYEVMTYMRDWRPEPERD